MSKQPRTLSMVAAAVVMLAGCLGAPQDKTTPNEVDPSLLRPSLTAQDGRDLRLELTQADRLGAPTWQIGERFRNHVFFGSDDDEGKHFDAIVALETADAWILATDDRAIAKENAVVDIPILGDVKKADLTMSGFGNPWNFYQFPIAHNATWQFDFPNIAWDSIPSDMVRLTSTATFAADISTSEGPRPGFQIVAMTEDGHRIAEYDYVPAIGWFAHFTIYDIDEDNDPVEFHVMSMGHDYNWTGTYYLTTARPLVEHLSGVGINPGAPTQPIVEPRPTSTFQMSSEGELLFGLVASIAIAGATEIALVSPSGDLHHWETVGAPEDELGFIFETPAKAGEWRIVTVGAGAVALAYLELYELKETTGEL